MQQLESSRIRLQQLEQELVRARQVPLSRPGKREGIGVLAIPCAVSEVLDTVQSTLSIGTLGGRLWGLQGQNGGNAMAEVLSQTQTQALAPLNPGTYSELAPHARRLRERRDAEWRKNEEIG